MKWSEWLDVNIGIYISICRLAPDECKKLGMGLFEILKTWLMIVMMMTGARGYGERLTFFENWHVPKLFQSPCNSVIIIPISGMET